jgi:hypothetical protein
MYKHYITINENDEVIDNFRDDQKDPSVDDILIAENNNRQFTVDIIDPMTELYINRYNHTTEQVEMIPENERGTQAQQDVIALDKCLQERRKAYRAEADGLYMEAIFDYGTPTVAQLKPWKDKVLEIKARLPKP